MTRDQIKRCDVTVYDCRKYLTDNEQLQMSFIESKQYITPKDFDRWAELIRKVREMKQKDNPT